MTTDGFSGEAMYREHILDHYTNPRNKGRLASASFTRHGANPLCGDAVSISASVKGDIIEKLMFEGTGCAISQAAASILTEYVPGKTLEQVKRISREEMLRQLGVVVTPARIKCALLALSTLKEAIEYWEELV